MYGPAVQFSGRQIGLQRAKQDLFDLVCTAFMCVVCVGVCRCVSMCVCVCACVSMAFIIAGAMCVSGCVCVCGRL